MGLYKGLPEQPLDTVPGFSWNEHLKDKEQAAKPSRIWPQKSHTIAFCCYILLFTQTVLIQCEKRLLKAVGIRRPKSSGAIWEAGHHAYPVFGICPSLTLKFSQFSPPFNTQIKAHPFCDACSDHSATSTPTVTLCPYQTFGLYYLVPRFEDPYISFLSGGI